MTENNTFTQDNANIQGAGGGAPALAAQVNVVDVNGGAGANAGAQVNVADVNGGAGESAAQAAQVNVADVNGGAGAWGGAAQAGAPAQAARGISTQYNIPYVEGITSRKPSALVLLLQELAFVIKSLWHGNIFGAIERVTRPAQVAQQTQAGAQPVYPTQASAQTAQPTQASAQTAQPAGTQAGAQTAQPAQPLAQPIKNTSKALPFSWFVVIISSIGAAGLGVILSFSHFLKIENSMGASVNSFFGRTVLSKGSFRLANLIHISIGIAATVAIIFILGAAAMMIVCKLRKTYIPFSQALNIIVVSNIGYIPVGIGAFLVLLLPLDSLEGFGTFLFLCVVGAVSVTSMISEIIAYMALTKVVRFYTSPLIPYAVMRVFFVLITWLVVLVSVRLSGDLSVLLFKSLFPIS